MKVTIDTQHDSYDDIQKVYSILAGILQRKQNNISSNDERPAENVDTSNLMSMFDTSSSTADKNISDKAPDFSSFLNLTKPVEKKEEQAEIEYY